MSVLKYHVHSKYRDISRDLVGHIEWGDEINTKKSQSPAATDT